MIEVRSGDILNSHAHGLVNTVNCVGIMGKGIALGFKKRYPDMFKDYVARCERSQVQLGKPYPYPASDGHIVVNFPTKKHWRTVSRLSDIVEGLRYLREHYDEWGIRSLAVPPLGCGNGQLDWRVVGPTLHRELSQLPIPVEMYAPLGTPASQMQLDFFTAAENQLPRNSESPTFIDPASVALVETLNRIESRRYSWPVGHTRFQKVAYFLASCGIPLPLRYERGSYGPYSAELKPIMSRLINNGLVEEKELGRMYEVRVGPTFVDARITYQDQLNEWDEVIRKVVDLFARMRTDQAEIAASVHFVSSELTTQLDRRPTEVEVLQGVEQWKQRRRPPLSRQAIQAAVEGLALLRWIDVTVSPELHDDSDDELVLLA